MSIPTSIYFLAILVIGLPSALRVTGESVRIRNATACAMVAMWLFGRLVWWLTGEWLPVQAMVLQDLVVIATIYARRDWRDCSPYRGTRHLIASFLWRERSPWDRAILVLFVPTWVFYTPVLPPNPQFWTLWGIGLVQLALAGHEAFHLRLQGNGQTPRADAPEHPPRSMFAPVTGRAYG